MPRWLDSKISIIYLVTNGYVENNYKIYFYCDKCVKGFAAKWYISI